MSQSCNYLYHIFVFVRKFRTSDAFQDTKKVGINLLNLQKMVRVTGVEPAHRSTGS